LRQEKFHFSKRRMGFFFEKFISRSFSFKLPNAEWKTSFTEFRNKDKQHSLAQKDK